MAAGSQRRGEDKTLRMESSNNINLAQPLPNSQSTIGPPNVPPPLMSLDIYPQLVRGTIGKDNPSPPRKSRKRGADASTNFMKETFSSEDNNYERYFIISKKEGDFSKISPFFYCNLISKEIGKVKAVRKLNSGALHVEAENKCQALLLEKLVKLGDFEVDVQLNGRLNTSKGVITQRDFLMCSEEEIREGMAHLGVLEVKRINRRQQGSLIPTASLILTFNRPKPPEHISVCYYNLKVRPFIPSPLRCYKCLKFGHTSIRCRTTNQVCACGLLNHEGSPCQEPPICVNCKGPHQSRGPECLVYQQEKEIQRIKTIQNLTYMEARKIVKSKSFVKPQVDYVSVAKNSTKSGADKRDWPKTATPFSFQGKAISSQVSENITPLTPSLDVVPTSSSVQVAGLAAPSTSGVVSSIDKTSDEKSKVTAEKRSTLPISVEVPTIITAGTRFPPRSPCKRELRSKTKIAQMNPPLKPTAATLNEGSSREEGGSDSDSGGSARTVLNEAQGLNEGLKRTKKKGGRKKGQKSGRPPTRLIAEHVPFGICLQETKLRPAHEATVRGYTLFSREVQPAVGGRAHGGVAILLRNNISGVLLPITTNLQVVAVRIKVPMEATLVSLYLPDTNWRKEDLESIIEQLPAPILLTGDFNSHNIWWGSNMTDSQGQVVEDIIENTNLILLNNGSGTHFNSYLGTFSSIDLAFASPALAARLEWSCKDELFQSDHFPIVIRSHISKDPYIIPTRYETKKADWDKFHTKFKNVTVTGDIDKDVLDLTVEITRAAEETIPKKGGILMRPPVPWWTMKCQEANREKKKAFNRFKRYPTADNLEKFKRRRAKERYIIKQAKRTTLSNYISKINPSSNANDVWKTIKSFSCGRKIPQVPSLLADGAVITQSSEVANHLARYYEHVSSTSQYNDVFIGIKSSNEERILDFTTNDEEDYNLPFSLDELEHVLSKVKDSAPGPDNIPYSMIQHLPKSGKVSLLILYNNILSKGYYPKTWREANIVPILKDGKDPNTPSSFRPISLTCCLGKILESLVNERLVHVLERRGHLNKYQAGFRKFHSTLDQLSHLEIYIQDAFSKREHVLAVFFDLEKAFDTTWRYGILKKCYEWNLRGKLLMLIKSFLEDRKFRVKVSSSLSRIHTQENGTPQGSVLSATLFAIAVNDIADGIPDSIRTSLYVDDLAIFLSGKDIDEMADTMQAAINRITQQAEKLGFKFSGTKTSCMHFCRMRKHHVVPPLHIHDTSIKLKEHVRFLGLILDSKLTWQEHIKQVASLCKRNLKILKFLSAYKWDLDREILLSVFTAMIRSKLEYGIQVLSSARKTRLKTLDSVYNLGIRLATGAFRTSPLESLYVESGIMPPQLRREQVLLSYAASLWGKENHFLFQTFFNSENDHLYEGNTTRTRPINRRVRELMDLEGMTFGSVQNFIFSEQSPWTNPSAEVRTDLSIFKKEGTSPCIYLCKFRELCEKYKAYTHIYTDGSKTNQGVGSSVYFKGELHKWSLPGIASIYTAELFAIYQALVLCLDAPEEKFLVCTDSYSSATSLKNKFTKDPTIQRIFFKLAELNNVGKFVVFIWLPSHIGITGNDMADRGAKEAASGQVDPTISIRADDYKNDCKKIMFDKWQQCWDGCNQKLKVVKPKVKSQVTERYSRRDRVVLTRLRIGHTGITHTYLLAGARPLRCPHCPVVLTVSHMLDGCPALLSMKASAGLTGHISAILKEGVDG